MYCVAHNEILNNRTYMGASDSHFIRAKAKMPMIDFTLRTDHSVLSPNFGDAEIRSIAFPAPDVVVLSIWLSVGNIVITVECCGVRWLAFQSNHMQNVVESMHVYPDLRSASFPKGFELPEYVASEYLHVSDHKMLPLAAKVLVVEPVTGGDLVCVCGSIKFMQQEVD